MAVSVTGPTAKLGGMLENYSYLFNLRLNIYKMVCLYCQFIPDNSDQVIQ